MTGTIHRFVAAAVACFLLASTAVPSPARAEPVRPDDDATVLAVVPAGVGGGSAFRAAERALAAAPDDPALAVAFARTAIEEGRARSDPRLYGRAEAALRPWWAAEDPPEGIRVLRAVIRQAGHDFSGALADLDRHLAGAPDDAAARLVRAGIRLVTGDVAGALDDCAAVPPRGGTLPGLVCRARAGAAMGQGERALVGLTRAIMAFGATDPAQTRFALMAAAEIAAGIGRTEEADRLSAMALGEAPDVPALAVRFGILLDASRPRAVLDLLDGAGTQDVLVLGRALAAKEAGDPALAGLVALLEERFAAAADAGSTLHRREEARFRLSVLGDAAAALPLAIDNFTVQKEAADVRLLLEAAIAAGRPEAAAPAIAFVRATGLADVRIAPLLATLSGRSS